MGSWASDRQSLAARKLDSNCSDTKRMQSKLQAQLWITAKSFLSDCESGRFELNFNRDWEHFRTFRQEILIRILFMTFVTLMMIKNDQLYKFFMKFFLIISIISSFFLAFHFQIIFMFFFLQCRTLLTFLTSKPLDKPVITISAINVDNKSTLWHSYLSFRDFESPSVYSLMKLTRCCSAIIWNCNLPKAKGWIVQSFLQNPTAAN